MRSLLRPPASLALYILLLLKLCAAASGNRFTTATAATTTNACKASDPALNLTKDAASGVYYASNDEEVERMCACSTIDYARIGWGDGGSCTCSQGTLDSCQLESISSKDPSFGVSLSIVNCPLIRSVQGLARVTGALLGGVHVHGMAELTTLKGLGNISRIGQDGAGLSIYLVRNNKLTSATALSNAKGDFSSDAVAVSANSLLACVPEHWAFKEQSGNSMGSSPWLFSCESTTGTCSRTANGTQSESACARSCVGGRRPKAAPAPAPAPAGTRAAKVCKASDPALNLTHNKYGTSCVTDDGQLQRICACSTIDYVWIACPTCAQGTLDACQLESISGQDPWSGDSLFIQGPAPHITSLRGLARLSGALPGGLYVHGMDELTTLEGLGNITRIGQDPPGVSIHLFDNPKLASAMALSNAKGTFTTAALFIQGNPQLACVPEQWPAKDVGGDTIRNGKALHDPCLYECDSAAHTCFQTATGAQSQSACASKRKESDISEPLLITGYDESEENDIESQYPNTQQSRSSWSLSMNTISFDQLRHVTNNFDSAHRIGDGGSCVVYKATLSGCECAIKVLSSEAELMEVKQFAAELDVLTRVKHLNLVELYAYSTDGASKCLVLELMDVALDERLVSKDHPPLGWRQRVQIILSVCRALVHLHSLKPKPLIHRDVKSQNVLLLGFESDTLDGDSIAKVADFGTVRTDTRNTDGKLRTSKQTHASTAHVIGTRPYMAPEYVSKGHVSEKTDAYSLGILIIELLISEYFVATDPRVMPHTACLEARELVDDEDHETLAAAVEAKSADFGRSTWASSSEAKHAARMLSAVAAKCVRGANRRSTPAEVLPELEAAAGGAASARSAFSTS